MKRAIVITGGVLAAALVAAGTFALTPARHAPPRSEAVQPVPTPALQPTVPNVAIAQAAYDQAKAGAQGRHIDGLKIDQTDCSAIGAARFLCQVRYARDDEPDGHLHFTVVTLTRGDTGWTLAGGLCRGDGTAAER